MNYNEIIGRNLKNLRMIDNLSIQELSVKLQLDAANIKAYEIGSTDVPIEVLIRYSKVFNLSIDDICSDKDFKEKQNEQKAMEDVWNYFKKAGLDIKNKDHREFFTLIMTLITGPCKDFDKIQINKVLFMNKILIRYNFNSKHIEGILELFNLFDGYSSEQLYDIFNSFMDIMDSRAKILNTNI